MATRAVVLLLCCITFTHAINILRDKDGNPALEVRLEKNGVERYRDELTGATDYVAIWEAQPTEGFQMIGQRAQPNWHYMAAGIPVVKDISGAARSQILVDPIGLQEVWRDQGGTGKMDVAFWRIVCPAGYHALSDIVYACNWCGWPRPEAYRARMRCVHEDFVEECSTTWLALWTNQGGMEKLEGSIWGVIPNDGLKNSGFWFGNTGHLTPPKDGNVYCLKQYETVDDSEIK